MSKLNDFCFFEVWYQVVTTMMCVLCIWSIMVFSLKHIADAIVPPKETPRDKKFSIETIEQQQFSIEQKNMFQWYEQKIHSSQIHRTNSRHVVLNTFLIDWSKPVTTGFIYNIYMYLEPKCGPIFWKIQSIKLKVNPPHKRGRSWGCIIYTSINCFCPLASEPSRVQPTYRSSKRWDFRSIWSQSFASWVGRDSWIEGSRGQVSDG